MLKVPASDLSDFFALMWSTQGKPIRALPKFPEFLRQWRLVALWDQYGAPDLCRRNDKGDYACN